MSNTQSLALCFGHKWLASLADNSMLSHCLLHPENCIDVENTLKAEAPNKEMKYFGSSWGYICFYFTRLKCFYPQLKKCFFLRKHLKVSYSHSVLTHQKGKSSYSWPCSALWRLDKYWLMCYVMTHCFSLRSAPGPQELHRVHREARCGGWHLPPLWNRLKYPEIAVGDTHTAYLIQVFIKISTLCMLLPQKCPAIALI